MTIEYKNLPAKCKAFACHGVEFTHSSGDSHLAGNCLFCGKEDHFFVKKETGQWKCHVCGESGNIVSFLTDLAKLYYDETTPAEWRELAKLRGLPVAAFKPWKVAYDGDSWLLPCPSRSGTIQDLRRWQPNSRIKSTAGCKVQLLGIKELHKSPRGRPVWICEGEWDAIALRWLLRKNNRKDVVVAAPGASTFKDEWVEEFDDHDVFLCYDADDAGDKGSLRTMEKFKQRGRCRSAMFLRWPVDAPKGFDVRDWIAHGWSDHRHELDDVLANLEDLLSIEHRLGKNAREAVGMEPIEGEEEQEDPPKHIPKWPELLKLFSKHLNMDEDMVGALTVCLATVASTDIPKDPLWFYLIAPPGGGKTTVLNTFRGSQRCVFRSSLTPASLVSGFKSRDDPSLLPTLAGKTGIFKDGTELLCIHPNAKSEVDSILRGAYDGDVDRTYGNSVRRLYHGLNFTLLIGMTPAIHGDSQANVGERFLKFQMQSAGAARSEDQIWAAMLAIATETQTDATLQEAVAAFLWRRMNPRKLPKVPMRYQKRIVALAQLIGMLRARVDREQYGERTIKYRPTHEVGTRLAKQLMKLGMSVAHVWGKPMVTAAVWELMERVAFDTAIGFHLDIVQALMKHEGKAPLAVIADETRLPSATLVNRIKDLRLLGIIQMGGKQKPPGRGRPANVYQLSRKVVSLWERAEVQGDYTQGPSRVRRRRTKDVR